MNSYLTTNRFVMQIPPVTIMIYLLMQIHPLKVTWKGQSL